MKAVIPAAGLGTRFLPSTKSAPKEMLPLLDRPAIQYVVEEAVRSGCDDILIVTGRTKRAIEDHFDLNVELEHFKNGDSRRRLQSVQEIAAMADIHYIRQREPRGLGDAVLQARKHVGDEPFALLLGDDVTFADEPCTKQLIAQQKRSDGNVVAVERVPSDRISSYGVVDIEPAQMKHLYPVRDLVEKPSAEEAPSDLGIIGRYVLTPEIFEALSRTRPGKNDEVQLTDALRLLLGVVPVHAWEFQGMRFDLGDKIEWLKTNLRLAMMREEYREALGPMMLEFAEKDRQMEVLQ